MFIQHRPVKNFFQPAIPAKIAVARQAKLGVIENIKIHLHKLAKFLRRNVWNIERAHVRLTPIAIGTDVKKRNPGIAIVALRKGLNEMAQLFQKHRVIKHRRDFVAGRAAGRRFWIEFDFNFLCPGIKDPLRRHITTSYAAGGVRTGNADVANLAQTRPALKHLINHPPIILSFLRLEPCPVYTPDTHSNQVENFLWLICRKSHG